MAGRSGGSRCRGNPSDMRPGFLVPLLLAMASAFAAASESSAGLAAALRATLNRHPALNGKRAEVEAKGFVGDSARAQRYPTFSVQVASQDLNNTEDRETNAPTKTLRARQPLWAFGRIDSAIAFADSDVAAEEADLVRLKRQLLDQTAVAYVRVLGARERLRVAEENVGSLDKLYQQIQRRAQGQLASLADVRLALARREQARAQQERFAGELRVAQTELRALTLIEVTAGPAVPENLTQLPGAAEVEALAQERSADVLWKSQRVALARADVEREKTASMPTLYLQADRYYKQPAFGEDTRVGLVVEVSLDGMGFAALGRHKAAGARERAAMEDLNTTRNDLVRSVNSLLANRQSQQTLIDTQKQSLSELVEIVASYQRQYEAGNKAWLEVLNMQRELSEQRLQLAQAENDWLIYTLRLQALIGSLDPIGEQKE